jgi:low affinity Fe/Cu permease
VLGPLFGYSENWQLVINTGTTIVTFLMVFLIQRAQNKDSLAIHLKLDELVAAHSGASNRLVSVEELSEHDLEVLRHHYRRLVEAASATDEDRRSAHSVEEHTADDAPFAAPLRPALAMKRGRHDS